MKLFDQRGFVPASVRNKTDAAISKLAWADSPNGHQLAVMAFSSSWVPSGSTMQSFTLMARRAKAKSKPS
jgi:hypothetical protein